MSTFYRSIMGCPNRLLLPKIEVFYRPECNKEGTTSKWTLTIQIKRWMLQTIRAEKVDEKNGVICLVSMFPSWVMVLKLSKKVHFLQFCADRSKKAMSVEVIYIYASESSR